MKNKTRLWSIGTIALAIITISAFAFVSCSDNLPTPLTGIGITPSPLTLEVDETGQLMAAPIPSTAGLGSVAWASIDPLIASVDSTGLVTGLTPGIATITAISGLAGGSVTVTVLKPDPNVLTGIGISPSPLNLHVDKTGQLIPAPIPATAELGTVTWTSDDPLIASVDNDTGLVTAVATGYTTIRASSGSVSGSVIVTVKTPVWKMASAGRNHGHAIMTDGSLWAWGWSLSGITGLGHDGSGNTPAPTRVGNEYVWAYVSASDNHSLAIRKDGSLWTWGGNSNGRTGLNTTAGSTLVPARIGQDYNWQSVSAGENFSLAIREDGSLWAWGNNQFGRTGLGLTGGTNNTLVPTRVGEDYDWESVSAGVSHSLAIRKDGSLWTWGDNRNGRTGLDTQMGDNLHPVRVGEDYDWLSVSAGSSHSLATKTDGSLWAWGNNSSSQVGIITSATNILYPRRVNAGTVSAWVFISAGSSHSHAIRADGSLWAWGQNWPGRTGLGLGSGNTSTPTQVSGNNWSFVSGGYQHSHGVRADGSLWAWGSGLNGRHGLDLGDGDWGDGVDVLVPTRMGAYWQ